MTKMNESASEWLNKEYFETVLRKHKKDEGLTIQKFNTSAGTTKGDSFINAMTRFNVEFLLSNSQEPHYGFYIVKSSYEGDPTIRKIMTDFDVYNREILMYNKILPEMTALLAEIGDDDRLFAETMHVDLERGAIIFEDLSASNFVVGNRIERLDEPQAKLVLSKLAKFHATGAVLNERMPSILTDLQGGFLRDSNRAFEPFHQGMVEVCAKFAGGCEELGPYYKEKLLKLKPKVMDYSIRCFYPKDDHFLTLIHSDMWSTNIMLKFNTEGAQNGTTEVVDARLIDFQFSNWSSPAVDLHYLINSSFIEEIRSSRQDEFIQYYHGILASTLKKLNYGGHIPSLHELCVQLEDRRFYAFTAAIVNQPLQTTANTEDADLNSLIEINERSRKFYEMLYSDPKVQNTVKALLPFFDRKGLLDITD
ncbi:unnamed protein product [Ceratitis capitata]|uniref:(Mediterranean fruit fly) hypothetical protein n=1 Tax=Ceratitis capitata TaxID=7213 RepID=A0A811TYU0_CERCA|nr:unnamed protein product [Ceratitis capitata]